MNVVAVTIGGEGGEGEAAALRVEGEELEVELAGAGETLASRSVHPAAGGDAEQRAAGDRAGVRGAGRRRGRRGRESMNSTEKWNGKRRSKVKIVSNDVVAVCLCRLARGSQSHFSPPETSRVGRTPH